VDAIADLLAHVNTQPHHRATRRIGPECRRPLIGGELAVCRVTVLLVSLCLLVACTAAPATSAPVAGSCDGPVCVSVSRLADEIRAQLNGRVVGYVALIGDLPVVAGGVARADSDPPGLAMGPDIMVNTASVGKIFTTVVVLKSLARHGRDPDTPILPFLPSDWARGQNVETITFNDLLTHRSGFRVDSGRIFQSDTAAREQVAMGVSASDKGQQQYNNINFSIVRDLLPRMEDVPVQGTEAADRLFVDRVQRDVFDPVGVHSARCSLPADPMLFYGRPGGVLMPGKVPPIGPAACASGGWFITVADMLRVLRGMATDDILTTDLRNQMNDTSRCLGWDHCTTPASHLKGGEFDTDGVGSQFQTYFGTVAGVPVVIATNSPSVPLETLVADAASSATIH
jgi:CubicO group peptidase (beta-lactamase class C family)